MPYPLPLTRTEAYLAYKAGVIQQSDLKPSLAVPRNGIDAWLAYWTGLAADYPKREDGTPHILQEEEAYIAYLCGVINEYPEKCLRRVGAYLRYLISARWGRPDHPLNREELYLSLLKTQVIPSGEPSSDIVIDGTAKAPFVDVKMYGDTFQQSYTGKNLFNKNNYPVISAFFSQGTPTITASGINRMTYIPCSPNTTYTVQKTASSVFSVGYTTELPAVGVTTYNVKDAYRGGVNTITTGADAAYLVVRFLNTAEDTATQEEMASSIQIETGSATSYEPYVGGRPSPNPEYPQQIQTVTGEQTVTVTGKNLLDIQDNLRASDSGLNFSFSNNELTVSGTPTRGWANVTSNISVSLPAGQYTFSVSEKLTHRAYLHIVYTDATSSDLFVIGGENTSATVTLVKDFNLIRLDFSFMTVGVTLDESFSLQLEAGSTATDHTPYSKQTLPISLGTIELCKITYSTSSWQDYIYKDGDDWKIHKATATKTFSGADSEDWGISNSGTPNFWYRARSAATGSYGSPDNARYLYCNYESGAHITSSNTTQGVFVLSGGDIRLRYGTEMSLDSWKAKLAATNMVLTYALATATDTEITNTALIAQLEALVAGGAENGTTYIKVKATDPNLPGLLYVEAPKYE